MSALKRLDYTRRLPQPRGSLSQLSLPELLHSCHVEAVSGILTVRRDPVEKSIYLLEGLPAFVESDLRTETLGHYLVSEGKITPIEHRLIIEQMRQSGRRQGDLLLEEKILSPHELFEAMLGHVREKIISCFAWEEGTFELLLGDAWSGQVLNLKIEPSRLILDGICRHVGLERLGPLATLPSHARATLRPDAPAVTRRLKMTTAEARIYDLAGRELSLAEIEREAGAEPLEVRRILYGLYILEIVGFEVGGLPRAESIPAHTPIPQRISPASSSPSPVHENTAPRQGRDSRIADVLSAYLRLKDADHFTLMGIDRDTPPKAVHGVFRELTERYSPKAVEDLPDDVQEKAAELYSKLVHAYQELANPIRRREYIERLDKGETVSKPPRSTPPPLPEDSHRTDDLLNEAKEALSADEHEKAVEMLKEALDLKKGEPLYEAWLGWALFLSDPDRMRKRAERHLEMARRSQPTLAEPYLFMARICEHAGDTGKAMQLYRTAKEHARGRVEIAREANIGELRTRKGRARRITTKTGADHDATPDRTDSALNQDVGALIRGLFSKDK